MDHFDELKRKSGSLWHLPTFAAVMFMLVLVIATSRDPFDSDKGSGTPVVARITGLSSSGSRLQGRWPGLRESARTDAGAFGVTTALPADLKGCKVGDRIRANQAGLKLYLEPRPCD